MVTSYTVVYADCSGKLSGTETDNDFAVMYSVCEAERLEDYEKRDIVETFRRSGLHGEDWPRTVYAIVTCKVDNARRCYSCRNTVNGDHAETKLLKYLSEKARDGSLSCSHRITMYVNYSPCHGCSRDIGSFMVSQLSARNVGLEVVVAGLCRIARPSCRSCYSHRMPSKLDHDRNVQGLIDLQNVGVVVRTFIGPDWVTLTQTVLKTAGFVYSGSSREREDWKLKADLQTVLMEAGAGGVHANVMRTPPASTPVLPAVRVTNDFVLTPPMSVRYPVSDTVDGRHSDVVLQPITVDGRGTDVTRQQARAPRPRRDRPDHTVVIMTDDTPEKKKGCRCTCTIL